jgi:hypothetical protein
MTPESNFSLARTQIAPVFYQQTILLAMFILFIVQKLHLS